MHAPAEMRDIRSPAHASPPVRTDLALRVFLLAVFFVPVQVELDALRSVFDSRLAPTDFLLLFAVLLNPRMLSLGRRSIDMLPIAFVAVLAYGIALVIVQTGAVTNHTVQVKFVGSLALGTLAISTAYHARNGHGIRIIRWLIAGTATWTLLSFIDWKVLNILPFLDQLIESRFGGMQDDPNNAGSLYALVMLLLLAGRSTLPNRAHWALSALIIGIGLAFTYSRGGYLAVLAGGGVTFWFTSRSAERVVKITTAAMALVGILVAAGVVQGAIDDFAVRPDNVAGRTDRASTGIELFGESYGLGIGLGQYRAETGEIIHNTALWLLVEMSLVGVALFAAMVIVPALALRPMWRSQAPLAGALLGAHVAMIVTSAGIEAIYQRHWWLLLGLMGGMSYMAIRPKDPRAAP